MVAATLRVAGDFAASSYNYYLENTESFATVYAKDWRTSIDLNWCMTNSCSALPRSELLILGCSATTYPSSLANTAETARSPVLALTLGNFTGLSMRTNSDSASVDSSTCFNLVKEGQSRPPRHEQMFACGTITGFWFANRALSTLPV